MSGFRHVRKARSQAAAGTRLLFAALLLVGMAFSIAVRADGNKSFVDSDALAFFHGADRIGAVTGTVPSAPVYQGNKVVGYVFETKRVAPFPAYSGQPVNVLVGIDAKGAITGTKVLEQHEPILLLGIPVQKLYDFCDQYIGKKVTDTIEVGSSGRQGVISVDAISSATVTAMVVNRTIMHAALKVAVARKIVSAGAAHLHSIATVKKDYFDKADWKTLTGNGSIRHLRLTVGQVDDAFAKTKAAHSDERGGANRDRDAMFIDLYYAYLSAPTIGRNLLGKSQYDWLMSTLKPGEHAVVVLGNGYSFKGSGYVRGGIFDRVHLVQNGQNILFHDLDYQRLDDTAIAGMPQFNEMAIFIVRKGNEFDPGEEWQLELLVRRQTGPVQSVFAAFRGDYQLPAAYYTRPFDIEDLPLWQRIWLQHTFQEAVIVASLGILGLILLLQDWFVHRPRLMTIVRTTFLVYTATFIGWYALGQLSVVNVFTFLHALFHDFQWTNFLMDPTLFILWAFVAVTLLLWGRGIYCGWLCPYGALQELVNKAARRLKVRQLELPYAVHERLWALKYVLLIVLFGISLQSVSQAERFAEVEPFKTAISLHFARSWPFVVYAAGLLVVSIFNRKFFCKYVCPLGAALAVAGRGHLFDWLKRRKEFGKPCQICAVECEIRSIHPTGEINMNECHYCLDCQVTYFNDHKCPPLVDRRKKRERAERMKREQQMERSASSSRLEDIPVTEESAKR